MRKQTPVGEPWQLDVNAYLDDSARRRTEDWFRHLTKTPVDGAPGWQDRFGLKTLY